VSANEGAFKAVLLAQAVGAFGLGCAVSLRLAGQFRVGYG